MITFFLLFLFSLTISILARNYLLLIVSPEKSEEETEVYKGNFSKKNFRRLLFWIGVPILGLFIADAFRTNVSADSSYKGLLSILLAPILVALYHRFASKNKH